MKLIVCYHLPCQTQPYESYHFRISLTSVQLSTTLTPLYFKVKDAKHQIFPSLLLHAYSFHFSPACPNSPLAMSAYLYLPTSLAPILFPSVSPIFNFLSPVCSDKRTRLPDPCSSSSFWCRVGVRWEDICAGKGTSHISDQLGNLTTFPHHLFFLASSDPFLMAKICLVVYNCATLLLDIYLLCASAS